MRLQFNLEYQTTFGEELVLNVINGKDAEQYKMATHDGLHWSCEMSRSVKTFSVQSCRLPTGAPLGRRTCT